MSITGIIMAAVIVGGTGLFIGIFLGLADKKLTVKVDEKEEAILGVLPGNNCGGCGYPGCSGLAAAIAKGDAPVDQSGNKGRQCNNEYKGSTHSDCSLSFLGNTKERTQTKELA